MLIRLTNTPAYAQSHVLVSPTLGGADFGMPARLRTTGVRSQASFPTAGVSGDAAGLRPWSPPIT